MRYIIAVFLAVFAVPAWADLQSGLEAYERGDYAEAVRWYRQAAEEGDPEAQYNLGVMYNFGRGLPQSDAQAMMWYREAAERGIADAAFRLGFMYNNGAAYPLWLHDQFYDQEASDNAGLDVPQDDSEALKWYRMGAEQGHALAQYYLGVIYLGGVGVPRDDIQGFLWYNLAAIHFQLLPDVSIDPSFQGITLKDFVLLTIALRSAAESLPSEQLAEVRRLAREWLEKHCKAELGLLEIGSTTVSEPAQPRMDSDICRSALASRHGVPRWDDRNASRYSVTEAKRRGLTPEKCSALLE